MLSVTVSPLQPPAGVAGLHAQRLTTKLTTVSRWSLGAHTRTVTRVETNVRWIRLPSAPVLAPYSSTVSSGRSGRVRLDSSDSDGTAVASANGSSSSLAEISEDEKEAKQLPRLTLGASDILAVVPDQVYTIRRSKPSPIPTGCPGTHNARLADAYKDEFLIISRTLQPHDDSLYDSLETYLISHTVVTPKLDSDTCSHAANFANDLLSIQTHLASMNDARFPRSVVRLYCAYIGFIVRLLSSTDCTSYSSLRRTILRDVLGIVLPLLFNSAHAHPVSTLSQVILVSLKQLLAAPARGENFPLHLAEYSRLSVTQLCLSAPANDDESVTLLWPEGGSRVAKVRWLQDAGRALQSITLLSGAEAWIDLLERHPSIPADDLALDTFRGSLTVYASTSAYDTLHTAITTFAQERPWSHDQIRAQMDVAGDFRIPVGLGETVTLEVAMALAYLTAGSGVSRADLWDVCFIRSSA
ncbi:hypothetical protein BC830DRAFT_1129688 [Chytriomyces sp. MP71]|nr:hypothetical protein BC830DRAFT_1129688 [Chytriomyces sp. MP71]